MNNKQIVNRRRASSLPLFYAEAEQIADLQAGTEVTLDTSIAPWNRDKTEPHKPCAVSSLHCMAEATVLRCVILEVEIKADQFGAERADVLRHGWQDAEIKVVIWDGQITARL